MSTGRLAGVRLFALQPTGRIAKIRLHTPGPAGRVTKVRLSAPGPGTDPKARLMSIRLRVVATHTATITAPEFAEPFEVITIDATGSTLDPGDVPLFTADETVALIDGSGLIRQAKMPANTGDDPLPVTVTVTVAAGVSATATINVWPCTEFYALPAGGWKPVEEYILS